MSLESDNRELAAKLLSADTHKDENSLDLVKVGVQSALHAAIQQPLDAVVQIGAAASQKKIDAPQIFDAPKQAEFGSGEWYAQTIGSGVGMVAPFLASEALVSGAGRVASKLGGRALAESIESTEAGAKLMPLARPVAHSFVSGATYGLLFTPSRDSDGNFIGDRFRNAAVGGITFGAQRAATLGISAATERAMSGGFEFARNKATTIEAMSRVGSVDAALHSTMATTAGRITANALAGGIAGGINANAHALAFDGRFATGDEMKQSAATFVVTGGALDAAHIGIAKVFDGDVRNQQTTSRTDAKVPPNTVEKSSGGSGGLADVHARLTEGAESERDPNARPHTEMVQQASTDLQANIKRALNIPADKDLSQYPATREVDQLISSFSKREFDIEGANANEVTRALRAVDSIVSAPKLAVDLSPAERVALAKQVLYEANMPKNMPTGTGDSATVLAMEQSISYWNPGRYAESVASLVTTGKYTSPGAHPVEIDFTKPEMQGVLAPNATSRASLNEAGRTQYEPSNATPTYAGQLNELLGMNLVTQTAPEGPSTWRPGQAVPNIEPAQLMRIFDLKTGNHKPELTLKKPVGSHFAMVDRTGNMKIFANDTVWAELGTQVDGRPLSITGKENANFYGAVDLASKSGVTLHEQILPTDVGFSKLVRVENTSDKSVTVTVGENFKPRVEDLFPGERGWIEPEPLPANRSGTETTPEAVTLTYTQQPKPPKYVLEGGRDENIYRLQLNASKARDAASGQETAPQLSDTGAKYQLTLAPGEAHEYQVDVRTSVNRPMSELGDVLPFSEAKNVAQGEFENWINSGTQVRFTSPDGAAVFNRSMADIATLMIPTKHGALLAAGVPDFVTIFGRDSKTASEQVLAFNPEVTKATLRADADLQGQIHDDYTAQEPGKMVHEVREGPLAQTLVQQADGSYRNALPFSKYYGSVDSTPMFLKLFGHYVDQTGDLDLVQELYPQIQKSLDLMDAEMKRGGGYLRYGGGNQALSNQGWKDSGISVVGSEGKLSPAPIALAEPQGYMYEAWMQMAKIEKLLAKKDSDNAVDHLMKASEMTAKAQMLSQRFQKDFWMKDKNYIALAIDGQGKQADVVTSNPGHLLATGILSPQNADIVARRMTWNDMSSGFGTRTMASSENPFFANSYHNGPVWLHDFWYWANGAHDVIPQDTARLTTEALDAVEKFPDMRVPELWGGYARSDYEVPIPYPRANSPQAWSGGAVLGLLSANLGLRPQAWANDFAGSLTINKPVIPEGFGNQVELSNYKVGDKTVSLRFTRNASGGADVEVLDNPNGLAIDVRH